MIMLPKLPTFVGNFYKGFINFHFSSEIVLGNFLLVTRAEIYRPFCVISYLRSQTALLLTDHHRHLICIDCFLRPSPPAFVDSSSYLASHYKTSFGTVCGASVLICPRMHCHNSFTQVGPQTMANEQCTYLDVYADHYAINWQVHSFNWYFVVFSVTRL